MSAISLTFPQPRLALLSFDLPGKGANVLSAAVMEELAAHLQTLERTADLQGVILTSAKPGTFIAGADIGIRWADGLAWGTRGNGPPGPRNSRPARESARGNGGSH